MLPASGARRPAPDPVQHAVQHAVQRAVQPAARGAAASRLLRLLIGVLCAILSGPALGARVLRVEAPRPDGRFAEVTQSAEARLLRAGSTLPLIVGMDVLQGDLIELDRARIVIELEPGERVALGEGSRVTWGERSFLETAGEAYLRLRSGFSVGFGSGEATVDGTRFAVTHDENGVTVRVDEGRVRVIAGGQTVAVGRGQASAVPAGAAAPSPAQKAAPRPPTAADISDAAGRADRLGLTVLIGARAIDGLQGGQTGLLRLGGYAALPGPLQAGAELGAITGGGRWHLEPTLTGGLDLGRLVILGEAGLGLGALTVGGEDQGNALVPILGGRARLSLPRDGRLRALVEARAGLSGRPALDLPVAASVELAVGGAWTR